MIYFYKKFTLEQEITKLKLALCHLRIEESKLKRSEINLKAISKGSDSLTLNEKKNEILKKEIKILEHENELITVKIKNSIANFLLFILVLYTFNAYL